MQYFKAKELPGKPFLIWQSVAENEEQLKMLPNPSDPLIIKEINVPAFQYGVCPWKIQGGQYVSRTPGEMAVFQSEFEAGELVYQQEIKIGNVNKSVFDFDNKQFPMNEVARLHYKCIERTPGNYKITSTAGQYNLQQADNPAFLNAFYNKLITLVG